jgi:hypothetical protein
VDEGENGKEDRAGNGNEGEKREGKGRIREEER